MGKTLEPWQALRVRESLYPAMNYIGRLRRRMEKVGFAVENPLYVLVTRVYEAMHALYNELHYVSCESGVGREPKKK